MLLGLLLMITALSISAVAIYYSIAGLIAIFAASPIAVMIMGGTLEIGKLVSAVWLHYYWDKAVWWLKAYLCSAVFILMLITSLGIFGFLSKAHIEQTSKSKESIEQIAQIDSEIVRLQDLIENSKNNITNIQSESSNRINEIREQIELEEIRVDNAYARIQPAIDDQQNLKNIENARTANEIQLLETQITSINNELEILQQALLSNEIQKVQRIVGVKPDNDFGPGTQRAITAYRESKIEQKNLILSKIQQANISLNEKISSINSEISRLRSIAENQISESNSIIEDLRNQLNQNNSNTQQDRINSQNALIKNYTEEINQLIETKYQLESDYRKLEAEVGPLKYLAEFIYSDSSDSSLLEESVRWVIILIIFVFDPLAVLLLIASQHTFQFYQNKKIIENRKKQDQEKRQERRNIVKSRNNKTKTNRKDNSNIIQKKSTNDIVIENNEEKARQLEYNKKEREENFRKEKELWKKNNPNETLKMYKNLYIKGKIDKLPWEGYLDENS